MKKCILLLILLLIFSPYKKDADVIYEASDFGIIANSPSHATANSKAINTLIRRAIPHTQIRFSKGTYYLDGVLVCRNKNGLSFIGGGSDFVNVGYDNSAALHSDKSGFLRIQNCNNITIRDLSMDYLDYCSVYGTITEASVNTLKIRLSHEYISNASHAPITGNEKAMAVNQLGADGFSVISDFYFNEAAETSFDEQTMIYTVKSRENAFSGYTEGNTALIRFSLGEYAAPAIMLENVFGFSVKNVNSYSCPGATVYGVANTADCEFENFNVAPKSGSGQILASNIDGIHLKNQSGFVKLTGSSFVGMGDDALNVNSRAAKIKNIKGKVLTVKDGYSPSDNLPSTWAQRGDLLRFYNNKWELVGSAKVLSFKGNSLVLDEEVAGLDRFCYIQNTRFIPQITIDNTVVDGSRARAFILRSANVSVTNCTIRNTALAGIIMAGDIAHWFEMGPSENVVIKNNSFYNCCCQNSAANYGVIAIKSGDDGDMNCSGGLHKNITITDNTIRNCRASAIYANAVSGLEISGNDIADTFSIKVINCDNVVNNQQ